MDMFGVPSLLPVDNSSGTLLCDQVLNEGIGSRPASKSVEEDPNDCILSCGFVLVNYVQLGIVVLAVNGVLGGHVEVELERLEDLPSESLVIKVQEALTLQVGLHCRRQYLHVCIDLVKVVKVELQVRLHELLRLARASIVAEAGIHGIRRHLE